MLIRHSCTYHRSVLELLRPFIPQGCGYDKDLCDPGIGELRMRFVEIAADAISNLRHLLQCHESLYAGLPIDGNFAAALIEVMFDSLSVILTHGRAFVGAWYDGLLTSLRMIKRMARPFRVMFFALQGFKHALAKERLYVPAEIGEILTLAGIEDAAWSVHPEVLVPKTNWVFDQRQKGSISTGLGLRV